MKKFMFVLAIVLFASSTAFAEYIPMIRQVENGQPGLCTYIVGITDVGQGGISCVCDLEIEGGAHQLSLINGIDTPYENVLTNTLLGEMALLDTRFLIETFGDYAEGFQHVGGDYIESHDGSDPYNVVANNPYVTSAGIGSFGMPEGEMVSIATAIRNAFYDVNSVEFMQIVVPYGGTATLTGRYTNLLQAEQGLPMFPFSITVVGVPEPSTLVLLVLSGLCFLGFRMRKNP